jgi:hypothetical protein
MPSINFTYAFFAIFGSSLVSVVIYLGYIFINIRVASIEMSLGAGTAQNFGLPLCQCTMTCVISSYDYNKALTLPYGKTIYLFI